MKAAQMRVVRYEFNGNIYKVIFVSKMKIGQLWVPCIIYQSYKDKKIWVRERGEFFEKFKPVSNDGQSSTMPSPAGGEGA